MFSFKPVFSSILSICALVLVLCSSLAFSEDEFDLGIYNYNTLSFYAGPMKWGIRTQPTGPSGQLHFQPDAGIPQFSPCMGSTCLCSGRACFSMNYGNAGGSGGAGPSAPRISFPDTPFVYSNNDNLNKTLARARFQGATSDLKTTVDGIPLALSPAEIAQSGYEYFRGITEYLNNPLPAINPSPLTPPTPLPSGTTRDTFAPYFEQIEEGTQSGPLQVVEDLAKLEQTVSQLEDLSAQAPYLRDQLNYIKKEASRLYLDEQGILKGTPFANFDAPLFSKRYSTEGMEIRKGVNQIVASQSQVNSQCLTTDDGPSQSCLQFNAITEELLLGFIVADRLIFNGEQLAYDVLMSGLTARSDEVVAFAKGFVNGAAGAWEGLAQIVSHPVDTVVGLGNALLHIDETTGLIARALSDKYDQFLEGDSITRSEIAGEIAFELVGLLVPAGKAAQLAKIAKTNGLVKAAAKHIAPFVASAQKLGIKTTEGIKDFADLSRRVLGNQTGAVGDLSKTFAGKMVRYGPLRKGPLSDIKTGSGTVADTFRSGSYFESVTEAPTKLYRVYDDNTAKLSTYYSRTKPTGPGQATLDSALDPNWGNSAQKWIEITVPPGETIYDGVVSSLKLRRGPREVSIGEILGGGSQVYINKKIPRDWISGGGDFFRYDPLRKGPLSDIKIGSGTVADTFRSGSYFESVTEAPTKLYRVYDENTAPLSNYYSRTKPTGPGQATLDSALDPNWGNSAQKWIEITVPPGETIYDGVVSSIQLRRGPRDVSIGEILGGGSQVYINKKIPRDWITDGGDF